MELGWIDFSKTERNKILSVLDLLSEKGTLDELGIAPVRDGFANLFFPGTSTIQTRAKYFFIVPYALKELEYSKETNPNRIAKAFDQIERDCAEQFLGQNQNEQGIIGKRSLLAGNWVKRTPADTYWSGLRQYGIFKGGNLSLSEYIRASCTLKKQKSSLQNLGNRNDNAEDADSDDKNAGNLFKMQFWKCPTYTSEWKDTLTIKLTPEEAEFLKEQINLTCKGTMLAFVLENDMREFTHITSFQELAGIIDTFPENIRQDYRLASTFSDFIYVVRTLYNVIVSDSGNEFTVKEFERLLPDFKYIADIDIDTILKRLSINTNPILKRFLCQVQADMKRSDVDALKKHIKEREIQLKGISRAKTAHPGEFDPDVWFGGGQLDYRFSNAKTIVKDIFEAGGVTLA